MKQPNYTTHYVDLEPHGGHGRTRFAASKETIVLEYPAQWRGRAVVLLMNADRYVYSDSAKGSTWSDWRIYIKEAREDTGGQGLGADLTSTARDRLRDEHVKAVEEWLRSPAYRPSKTAAYVRAVEYVGRYQESRHNGDFRAAITANAKVLPKPDVTRLTRAADAYDKFLALIENKKED